MDFVLGEKLMLIFFFLKSEEFNNCFINAKYKDGFHKVTKCKKENRISRYLFVRQSRQSTSGNNEQTVCVETRDDRCALRINNPAFCSSLYLLKSSLYTVLNTMQLIFLCTASR